MSEATEGELELVPTPKRCCLYKTGWSGVLYSFQAPNDIHRILANVTPQHRFECKYEVQQQVGRWLELFLHMPVMSRDILSEEECKYIALALQHNKVHNRTPCTEEQYEELHTTLYSLFSSPWVILINQINWVHKCHRTDIGQTVEDVIVSLRSRYTINRYTYAPLPGQNTLPGYPERAAS